MKRKEKGGKKLWQTNREYKKEKQTHERRTREQTLEREKTAKTSSPVNGCAEFGLKREKQRVFGDVKTGK